MKYSIEPRDRMYVKGYGFMSCAKSIGKNLSNKYSQKIIDTTKKSETDAIKTASKRTIQKTTEATGDMIGNKIVDKITSISKKNLLKTYLLLIKIQNYLLVKKDIYHQKKDNKLLMN